MGTCGCSREKLTETKDAAVANMSKAGEYTRVKYHETKNYLGPIIQEKYEESKMKIQQYRPEKIDDNSKTKSITKFEETLPLKKMTVEEFERRIKKFGVPKEVGSQDADKINELQLIEGFKDYFPDIEKEGSLIRQLLLNPGFAVERVDGEENYEESVKEYKIPELLLLGNMYCANTPYYRAQKFFEVCQEELQPQIGNNDNELSEYMRKQFDIAYYVIMVLYNVAKDPKEQPIPDEWLNLDQPTVEGALDTIMEEFLDDVFGSASKLQREDFIEKLRGDCCKWLQPHFLRSRMYQEVFEPKKDERKL
ncbi:UNKNOWN [Stylonychia lemnae]|uniref:Uncharacterized protein n=1 Tax=Stylonychia lemnae TaxID=5949 RepID=A0A078AG72_STYLE|nr:UNKNOWN [Stylonychia lemnae]|eukprot:CDW81305.1 UNKNOWN [Stylonychia lemnae]